MKTLILQLNIHTKNLSTIDDLVQCIRDNWIANDIIILPKDVTLLAIEDTNGDIQYNPASIAIPKFEPPGELANVVDGLWVPPNFKSRGELYPGEFDSKNDEGDPV